MSTLVMKFGGTSVGSAASIQQCVQIVSNAITQWTNTVVVTSAMSGVTDLLLEAVTSAEKGDTDRVDEISNQLHSRHLGILTDLIHDPSNRHTVSSEIGRLLDQFCALCQAVTVLGEASPRARDAIASLGERMSVRILAAALQSGGVKAEAVDASRAHYHGRPVPIRQSRYGSKPYGCTIQTFTHSGKEYCPGRNRLYGCNIVRSDHHPWPGWK